MRDFKIKKIGEICKLTTGGTPSRSHSEYFGGDIKWLVSGDINKKEIFDCNGKITDVGFKNSSVKMLPKNCLLIALNGQGKTRGTVAILRTEATCNQSLVAMIPNSEVLVEYLYFNLSSRYHEIRRLTGESDRRGLNMPIIRNIEIPVPSIDEQKRIINRMGQISLLISKRNESINLLNEYLNSKCIEMFGNLVINSKKWNTGDGNKYSKKISVGVVIKPASYYVEKGIPALRSQNVTKDGIKTDNLVYFSEKNNETVLAKSQIKENDVLIVRTGQPGTAAIVPKELDGANCIDIIIVRLKEDVITPEYLVSFFNSAGGKDIVLKTARGQIQQHFNIGSLIETSIPLPPIDLQRKFSDIFNAQKILKSKMLYELEEIEDLFKSQMQKAFS